MRTKETPDFSLEAGFFHQTLDLSGLFRYDAHDLIFFMEQLKHSLNQVFKWFLSGVFILLPLGATLILIGWVLNFLNELVGGRSIFAAFWQTVFGWLPVSPRMAVILGYLVMLAAVVIVGYFAQGFAKQRVGAALRSFFDRIPIVNKVYGSVEQVIGLWSKKQTGDEITKIGEVVVVDFANVKAFGILSSRTKYKMNGGDYYLVYLPSAPVPATGFTYFIKAEDVHLCDVKMDDMTKVVVSLGVLGQEVMGKEVELKNI